MDELPEQLVWEILGRIRKTVDRNSISLACKRLYEVDNEQRIYLRVGCGLNPANEALASLRDRFPNLTKVERTYPGWMSRLGKQIVEQGLSILSGYCPLLSDLTLSYCSFITGYGPSLLGFLLESFSFEAELYPNNYRVWDTIPCCRLKKPHRSSSYPLPEC